MASSHLFNSPSLSFPNPSLHSALFPSSHQSVSYPSISLSFHKALTRSNVRKSHLVLASIVKLSEAERIPIVKEPGELDGRIPAGAGVYGVYDSNGDLQFIGTSRSILLSINKHRRWVSELCSSVKVGPMEPVSHSSRAKPDWADLKSAWEFWIEEHMSKTGKFPPGNLTESDSWIVSPPRVRLSNPSTEPVQTLIHRLLRVHEAVVFVHGPITKVLKAPDFEYVASVRLVGVLLKHDVDFVTVDLSDEEGNAGVRRALEGMFGVKEIPQVFVKGVLIGGEEAVLDLVERGKLHTVF